MVRGGERAIFASDAFQSFADAMNKKYPHATRKDPKMQKGWDVEYAAFVKKNSQGSVSADRLKKFCAQMHLRLLDKAPSK